MTIQELKTKIEKARKNSMLPEKLKAAIISKLEKELAELENSEKKEEPKAEEPKKEAKKHKAPREKREDETHEEYEKSCKELIAEDKERKAKSRKASKKSEDKTAITKDLEAAEKLGNRAEKQYKHGELTKAQIEKLIKELQAQIKHLTELLKKAPTTAKTEEGWKHKKKSKIAKKERGGYVGEDWIGQEVIFQGKKFKVEKRDKDGIYILKGEKKGLLGGRDEMIATEKELQERFELVPNAGKVDEIKTAVSNLHEMAGEGIAEKEGVNKLTLPDGWKFPKK